MKIYEYPQEVWNESKCAKVAKKRERDGYGSIYPHKGLVQPSGCAVNYYGRQIFNGGTIIGGEWYKGYEREFPKIPDTYEYFPIMSWGIHIRKKLDTSTCDIVDHV